MTFYKFFFFSRFLFSVLELADSNEQKLRIHQLEDNGDMGDRILDSIRVLVTFTCSNMLFRGRFADIFVVLFFICELIDCSAAFAVILYKRRKKINT